MPEIIARERIELPEFVRARHPDSYDWTIRDVLFEECAILGPAILTTGDPDAFIVDEPDFPGFDDYLGSSGGSTQRNSPSSALSECRAVCSHGAHSLVSASPPDVRDRASCIPAMSDPRAIVRDMAQVISLDDYRTRRKGPLAIAIERLDRAVARLDPLVHDRQGPLAPSVERELALIARDVGAARPLQAAIRAERLADLLEHPAASG
jgi:hypothetical protein